MSLRLHVEQHLGEGMLVELPAAAARHVQVRRLQPGDALVLFNGMGGQWTAMVDTMGRTRVSVRLVVHEPAGREPDRAVTLAVGMPANERMDWLVEKAGELGARALVPLLCERSVLRLEGERAARRREHWQAVAVAAAEQSGGTHVMQVAPIQSLGMWLGQRAAMRAAKAHPTEPDACRLLSLRPQASAGTDALDAASAITVLSGPEGGLTPGEEDQAESAGFVPVSLGQRTLRAETAPLVALARWLT